MFNKNKKNNPISNPFKSSKDKKDVTPNKTAVMLPREDKDTNKQKSAMRSEGGKN
jgi:hypothetical protein